MTSSLSTTTGGPSGAPNLLPSGAALLTGGFLLILALWMFGMTFTRGAKQKAWKRLIALIIAAAGIGLIFFSRFILAWWTPQA